MNQNWGEQEKIECEFCLKEISKCVFNNHLKRCKEKIRWENKIENEDYVVCKICNKKLSEINTAHLNKHNITLEKYKSDCTTNTISNSALLKKKTLLNISDTTRENLRKSHTLEGYKNKYGEEGEEKYKEMKNNKSNSKKLERYIEIYGEEEGLKIFKEINQKRARSLQKFIEKYGFLNGTYKYNQLRKVNSLTHYQLKYGVNEGLKKWEQKNIKSSISKRKVNDKAEYELYCREVDYYSNKSIRLINLDTTSRKRGLNHLDHKFSKLNGFLNNVPCFIIGSIYNLELISETDNTSKQDKNSITLEELLDNFNSNIAIRMFYEDLNNCKNGYNQ